MSTQPDHQLHPPTGDAYGHEGYMAALENSPETLRPQPLPEIEYAQNSGMPYTADDCFD